MRENSNCTVILSQKLSDDASRKLIKLLQSSHESFDIFFFASFGFWGLSLLRSQLPFFKGTRDEWVGCDPKLPSPMNTEEIDLRTLWSSGHICYKWAFLWFMYNVKICALCKILARLRLSQLGGKGSIMNERLHYWRHFFTAHNGSKLMGDKRENFTFRFPNPKALNPKLQKTIKIVLQIGIKPLKTEKISVFSPLHYASHWAFGQRCEIESFVSFLSFWK